MKAPPRPVVIIPPEPPPPARGSVHDDVAYVLPMLVFLGCVFVGATWKGAYAEAYLARALVVPILLTYFWRRYTRIRWNHWWLGAIVGVVGIFQWVVMQKWVEAHLGHLPTLRPPSAADVFDPFRDIGGGPWAVWGFIAVRVASAVLLVPVMEELFWRDFLWRQLLAPNDFKLASVGEWSWLPFVVTSLAFGTVHGHWWITSIVWAFMVAALLVYTRSLGACIIAHAVTNLLLAVYVLRTGDWAFW